MQTYPQDNRHVFQQQYNSHQQQQLAYELPPIPQFASSHSHSHQQFSGHKEHNKFNKNYQNNFSSQNQKVFRKNDPNEPLGLINKSIKKSQQHQSFSGLRLSRPVDQAAMNESKYSHMAKIQVQKNRYMQMNQYLNQANNCSFVPVLPANFSQNFNKLSPNQCQNKQQQFKKQGQY